MIPTAVPWGYLYNNIIIVCFGTKYDANLEIMSCQVYFINLSILRRITGVYRSKHKVLRASRLDGGLRTK